MHLVRSRFLVVALGAAVAACGGTQRAKPEAAPVRDTREGDDFEYREGAVPAGPAAAASDDDDDKDEDAAEAEGDDDDDEDSASAGKVEVEVDGVESDGSGG